MTSAAGRATIGEYLGSHPYGRDFLGQFSTPLDPGESLASWAASVPEGELSERGLERGGLVPHLERLARTMEARRLLAARRIGSITVLGGRDKSGRPEDLDLVLRPGEIVCIVGPTGSGKSRFLSDIECMAQRDTPTGRQVLVDGLAPDREARFSLERKLVAQISQNMNFVVDLPAGEFARLHALSRMVESPESAAVRVVERANELAGERFSAATPVTQLSGGQSRALMIADVAVLGSSPVVLIDEIENAGVDRRKALDLLVGEEKIVLISTHDPLLALMGGRRLVVENGGVAAVISGSPAERANLEILSELDRKLSHLRHRIREGGTVEEPLRFG